MTTCEQIPIEKHHHSLVPLQTGTFYDSIDADCDKTTSYLMSINAILGQMAGKIGTDTMDTHPGKLNCNTFLPYQHFQEYKILVIRQWNKARTQ